MYEICLTAGHYDECSANRYRHVLAARRMLVDPWPLQVVRSMHLELPYKYAPLKMPHDSLFKRRGKALDEVGASVPLRPCRKRRSRGGRDVGLQSARE